MCRAFTYRRVPVRSRPQTPAMATSNSDAVVATYTAGAPGTSRAGARRNSAGAQADDVKDEQAVRVVNEVVRLGDVEVVTFGGTAPVWRLRRWWRTRPS